MPELVLREIRKEFDGRSVLEDVSLELAAGELLVLLGPSGCGKSTLLRLIAGLEELDRGEILLGERRIDRLPPKDRNVAMVFQNYSLYPHMTVEQNLAFPLKVAKVSRAERMLLVARTAALLGLEDRLKLRPGQLSGGQRQRVALGRAIIREPALFLLDEPLSNLDADLRARMRVEIVGLQKRLGTTMIHVTHDQAEALTMADRIGLLHEGRLVQLGTPEQLYNEPATLFAAQFVGSPRINAVPVTADGEGISVFGFARSELGAAPPAGELTAAVRPEKIRIEPEGRFAASVIG
ncbi:MAG TPA: ABC transporter ATP-binding protein, partial [candidate division Zixibacteria bacterium]|nr:ABC transporter ATP-binding protein [candidate division Zixibacteria bacterium]